MLVIQALKYKASENCPLWQRQALPIDCRIFPTGQVCTAHLEKVGPDQQHSPTLRLGRN